MRVWYRVWRCIFDLLRRYQPPLPQANVLQWRDQRLGLDRTNCESRVLSPTRINRSEILCHGIASPMEITQCNDGPKIIPLTQLQSIRARSKKDAIAMQLRGNRFVLHATPILRILTHLSTRCGATTSGIRFNVIFHYHRECQSP